MVKKNEAPDTENTEATNNAEGTATATAADNRYKMIKDPVTGAEVKRVDWIRQVFQDKDGGYYGDRSKIAKKLTELAGEKVPYQIVFAATKEMKHIKKPVEVPAETAPADGAGETAPAEG